MSNDLIEALELLADAIEGTNESFSWCREDYSVLTTYTRRLVNRVRNAIAKQREINREYRELEAGD